MRPCQVRRARRVGRFPGARDAAADCTRRSSTRDARCVVRRRRLAPLRRTLAGSGRQGGRPADRADHLGAMAGRRAEAVREDSARYRSASDRTAPATAWLRSPPPLHPTALPCCAGSGALPGLPVPGDPRANLSGSPARAGGAPQARRPNRPSRHIHTRRDNRFCLLRWRARAMRTPADDLCVDAVQPIFLSYPVPKAVSPRFGLGAWANIWATM